MQKHDCNQVSVEIKTCKMRHQKVLDLRFAVVLNLCSVHLNQSFPSVSSRKCKAEPDYKSLHFRSHAFCLREKKTFIYKACNYRNILSELLGESAVTQCRCAVTSWSIKPMSSSSKSLTNRPIQSNTKRFKIFLQTQLGRSKFEFVWNHQTC